MKKILNIILIVLCLGLVIVPRINTPINPNPPAPGPGPGPGPNPKPADTFGFETTLPALKIDVKTSSCIAGLCDSLADILAKDGQSPAPKYTYVANVFDLRQSATEMAFNGKDIKDTYPAFGTTTGPVFASNLGVATDPLTPEKRAKAVAIFKAISYSLRLK